MSKVESVLKGLGAMIVASVVLIGLALLYFMVTAWIVDFGVGVVSGSAPSADFTALSAAILTLGGLAGSSFRLLGSGMTQEEGAEDYSGQEVA